MSVMPTDELLDIEPLLERVERLEDLVDGMRRSPAPAPADYVAALADLERRMDEQSRDLDLLREQIADAERRGMESAAAAKAEIPEIVERSVAARTENLRSRFSAEIEQSRERMLEVFERAIDDRISPRIGAIERTLAEQAGSIEALNTRAAETDRNLQRLVSAIEKLCERAPWVPPAAEAKPAEPAPYAARAFESQLQDAMRREEPPVDVPAPAFAAGETHPKKSRFLFRNLMVAGFALLASRFLR
jgi:uncharacterized coiled-coil protein SlyX